MQSNPRRIPLTQTQSRQVTTHLNSQVQGTTTPDSGALQQNLANHLLTSNLVSNEVSEMTQTRTHGTTTAARTATRTTGQTNAVSSKKGPVTKDGKLIIYEEVPVFVEKIVEVPFENIIERPVEKRIENRYYVDREVEVIKEVVKEVPKIIEIKKEKIIEIEKFVDEEEIKENHIDVVEEVVKVVEVPQIEYQDEIVWKNVEVLKVKPHRKEIKENVIYQDKINVVEKVVTKDKVITNNIYIEKSTGDRVPHYDPNAQIQIIEEVEEQPYNVYVDKIVEVKREVPYEVVKEVDNVIVERVPREKEVVHTEYYDDIKVVEVPVENIVEVEVTKEVIVDKYVDKEVIVEVEKKIPVPKHVEKIITKVVDVPVIREVEVEVPYEKVVENRFDTDLEVLIAEPKVTHVNKEFPVIQEVHENEDLEIEFEVDKIVENEVHIKNEVPVDIKKQVVNTISKMTKYDKQVELTKTVEVPNVRTSYRDVPIQRSVQQSVIIEQPVIQENLKVITKEKPVDVVHTSEVVQYNEVEEVLELKNEQKTSKMTGIQKSNLERINNDVSKVQLENLKLRTDIQSYEELITQIRGVIIDDESLEANKAQFREKISNLDSLIMECSSESRRIETEIRNDENGGTIYEDVDVYTEAEIQRLEAQIKEVEERNQKLRELLGKVDIRSSKVGEMSSVAVKESVRMTREVEQKLNSYERDPNARITQGQKMATSTYISKPAQGTTTSHSYRNTTSSYTVNAPKVQTNTVTINSRTNSGNNQVYSNQGGRVMSGGYTSSTWKGQTTSSGTTGYQTQGYSTSNQGYSSSVTKNTTVTESKSYQTSTTGKGVTKTTVSESYTNSAHPDRNYSYTNSSTQPLKPYSVVTNNAVRESKVIKESPGEYVPSRSLVNSQQNKPVLFSRESDAQRYGRIEESRVISTRKNVTHH